MIEVLYSDAVWFSTRADTQADDQNCEQRESWILAHHTKRISEILNERLQERNASGFTVGFAQLADSAEFDFCQAFRLLRRGASPDVFFGSQGDVRFDLGRKIMIELASEECCPDCVRLRDVGS